MFVDWGSLITTIITTIVVSGSSIFLFFIFFKQRKKKENSDVVDKDASAATNMLEFTTNYYNFTERIVKDYQETISKKDNIILENQSKLIQLEEVVQEHSKKIKNLTNMLLGEQRRRSYAENNICLTDGCTLRKPALGTFKTINENVNDKV